MDYFLILINAAINEQVLAEHTRCMIFPGFCKISWRLKDSPLVLLGIKYGKVLEQTEMQSLLENLFACENPMYSPNGKPVIMEMSKLELDAFFKK